MLTIRTFTNQAEASFYVSFLQAHAIDAVLLDEGSFAWNFAGAAIPIRLQVPDEQAPDALEFLHAAAAEIAAGDEAQHDSDAQST